MRRTSVSRRSISAINRPSACEVTTPESISAAIVRSAFTRNSRRLRSVASTSVLGGACGATSPGATERSLGAPKSAPPHAFFRQGEIGAMPGGRLSLRGRGPPRVSPRPRDREGVSGWRWSVCSRPVPAALVADAVQQPDVLAGERITASTHWDYLINFACEGVIRWESLVDLLVGPFAVFPCAGLLGGEDACPELPASVPVGVARVRSHAPSYVCTRRRGTGRTSAGRF